MPRARNIKASFFSNDELGDLDPLARLLFVGLWTLADYKGDLIWREKKVKAQLLPYDNCCVKKLAINLDKSGFIRFYSDGERIYLNIINFTKHQNPHNNERKKGSDIPKINEEMRQAIDLKGITINRDKSGLNQECSTSDRADSLILIPDPLSLTPDSSSTFVDGISDDDLFDQFWNAGMVKSGKKACRKSFDRIIKSKTDKQKFVDALVDDITWRKQNQQMGFDLLHPTTYLNGERWDDEKSLRTFASTPQQNGLK